MVFEEEEEKQAKEEQIQAKEAKVVAFAPRPWTSIAPALSFSKIIAAAPALNQKDEEKKAAVAAAKAIPYKPKVIVAQEREVKWEAKRIDWADADNSDYDSGEEDEDEEETSAW